MSLESAITALVDKAQALIDVFTNKVAAINAAVQAAVATAPSLSKTIYINNAAGNDLADGLTEATAVQTLSKALSFAPMCGELRLRVIGDLTLTEPTYYVPRECILRIIATAKKQDGSCYNIKPTIVSDGVGGYRLSSIACSSSSLRVYTEDLGLEFPVNTNNVALSSTVVFYSSITGSFQVALKMSGGNINSVGRVGILTARAANPLSLYLYNTTYNTSDMAGRWVSGVSANKLPTDFNDIFTNLTAL